eukprot:scaffold2552_cov380-Prasinococcus_capsulatus_cf.AAC.25
MLQGDNDYSYDNEFANLTELDSGYYQHPLLYSDGYRQKRVRSNLRFTATETHKYAKVTQP